MSVQQRCYQDQVIHGQGHKSQMSWGQRQDYTYHINVNITG